MRSCRTVVCILLMLLALGALSSLEPGDIAPAFANPDLEGRFHFSRNYLLQDWVLLNFFATWCVPCKENLPGFIDLDRRYTELGLQTVLFAIDSEGPAVVRAFFSQNPVDFPVLLDRYQVTMHDRYQENSVPVYFLIDPEGHIRYKGSIVSEINGILALEFGLDIMNEEDSQKHDAVIEGLAHNFGNAEP